MFRSLRVKLTLWYICVLALIFAAFAAVTYSLFLRAVQDETKTNISEMAGNFITSANQLQNEKPHGFDPNAMIDEVLDEFQFRDYRFAVFAGDASLIGTTTDPDLTYENVAAVGEGKFANVTLDSESYQVFEKLFSVEGKPFRLFVFYSLADQAAIESRIRNIFLVIAPVLLFLAGVVGFLLARTSLRPVVLMGERAKQIGANNLHERLPVANPEDEIGNLAVLFNQLLDRLSDEFDKQRRFMADASHELRTPLAIVRGESEVALQKDDRTGPEYRESLKIVNDEGRRLSKIVEDMFTLARVDAGNIQGSFREVYLDEIVDDCVKKIRTLADQKNITVKYDGVETRSFGDEALLQRLFINLLDNAVKYNHRNGRIQATVSGNSVEIKNTGPDIPVEKRELIFERFFRIDKAHSRQADTMTSGAGLGLSIARWIADLHNAEIVLHRSNEGENIFSVTFPS
ncbi:MAG: ATP-binding protein [Pyrinomonadaceae bacterium]